MSLIVQGYNRCSMSLTWMTLETNTPEIETERKKAFMTLKNALIQSMIDFPKVYLELQIREGGYLLPMVSDWC